MPATPPRLTGWHDRGYLPHLEGMTRQAITYRLADALPQSVVDRLDQEVRHAATEDERALRLRKKIEAFLDSGHGSCALGRPDVATMIIDNWRHFDPERYRLEAFVVMPNHVHVLIAVKSGQRLSDIVRSWKTYTAKRIQMLTGMTGTVWQADYWDRYVRDEDHHRRMVAYILENPVKAGLAKSFRDWPWSGAFAGGGHGTA